MKLPFLLTLVWPGGPWRRTIMPMVAAGNNENMPGSEQQVELQEIPLKKHSINLEFPAARDACLAALPDKKVMSNVRAANENGC